MSGPFAVIHISDLHFHRFPRNPLQWFSKRGLGALNLIRRRRLHPPDRARRLVEKLDGMDWDHLVVTGDLTQLALEEEFALARDALAPLLNRGSERVTVLPGNHDRYVREPAGRDFFRQYFGDYFGTGEIATHTLTETWHLAGWDSALPTPPLVATGRVRDETLAATEQWMEALPSGAKVILANHYPLYFQEPYGYRRLHSLHGIEEVRRWVGGHPVALYLHGHLHRNWVLKVESGSRVVTHVNSASSTQIPRAGGSSAFHRILLDGSEFRVEPQALD